MVSQGNYQYYEQTGNCPLLSDLNFYLNGLFTDINSAATPSIGTWNQIGQTLTSKLFGEFTGQAMPLPSNVNTPTMSIQVTSNDLIFSFTPSVLSEIPLKLTLPASAGLSWNNYGSGTAWRIVGFSQLYYDRVASTLNPTNPSFGFKVIAKVQIGSDISNIREIVLTGSTVAKIGECHVAGAAGIVEILNPITADCDKKEQFGDALNDLVLHLQTIGNFESSDFEITNDTVFANSYLKTYLGINSGDLVTWVNTSGIAMLYVNNVKRSIMNLADFSQGDIIASVSIGALKTANQANVLVLNLVPQTGRASQILGTISSGNQKNALYFACCAPCGEWDYNGDGFGDLCDNPCGIIDTDGDGVLDNCDNCINTPNPNQEDTNGDGIGDLCNIPCGTIDTDSDGVFDNCDNCINTPNSNQEDANGNGIGDLCESLCGTVDTDGDEVFDNCDNYINTPNSDQSDTDENGIGDACQQCEKKHIGIIFRAPYNQTLGGVDRLRHENLQQGVLNFLNAHNNTNNNLSDQFFLTSADDCSGCATLRFQSVQRDLGNSTYTNFTGSSEVQSSPMAVRIQDNTYSIDFIRKFNNMIQTNNVYGGVSVSIARKIDVIYYILTSVGENNSVELTNSYQNLYQPTIGNAKKPYFIFFVNDAGNIYYNNTISPVQYINGLGLTPVLGGNYSIFNFNEIEGATFPNNLNSLLETEFQKIPKGTSNCNTEAGGTVLERMSGFQRFDAIVNSNCTGVCIPQTVDPASCNEKYTRYTTFFNFNAEGNSQLIQGLKKEEAADFCASNLQYLVEDYISYSNALQITTTEDPNFITLAEFGDTQVHYGYKNMNIVIANYGSYAAANASNSARIFWQEYVNTIYVLGMTDCPPAAMPSNVNLDPLTSIPPITNPCIEIVANVSASYQLEYYNKYLSSLRQEFINKYIKEAMENVVENCTMEYTDKEYQYTLYYYDQAGNLIQTVAPEGVKRLSAPDEASTLILNQSINSIRNGSSPEVASALPEHTFKTEYKYNSLNQLVWQETPDGGKTRFAYDALGRIITSQNAKQSNPNLEPGLKRFSYTNYDYLGRIIEAGEIHIPQTTVYTINDDGKLLLASLIVNEFVGTFDRTEVTRTVYTEDPVVETTPSVVHASNLFTTNSIQGFNPAHNNRNRVTGVY